MRQLARRVRLERGPKGRAEPKTDARAGPLTAKSGASTMSATLTPRLRGSEDARAAQPRCRTCD